MNEIVRDTLVILGPTASGKTALAVRLAAEFDGEILSADSRQVYRGLDIGSGKDIEEYRLDGRDIPCHLIDIAGPEEEFSVFHYQQAFYRALEEVRGRGALPVIAGGSGLYLEAVLQGYRMTEAPENPALREELAALSDADLIVRLYALRPDQHNVTNTTCRDRCIRAIEIAEYTREYPPASAPELHPLLLGMKWPRAVLRDRIDRRLRDRLNNGLIEEVQGLLEKGWSRERLDQLGLEYRFVVRYLDDEIRTVNDLRQKLVSAIGRFAKRQETWFRRMERQGMRIIWIPGADLEIARKAVRAVTWKR
jgi:tRNA dimethylallyltransferase